jgi:hypothetical protein
MILPAEGMGAPDPIPSVQSATKLSTKKIRKKKQGESTVSTSESR